MQGGGGDLGRPVGSHGGAGGRLQRRYGGAPELLEVELAGLRFWWLLGEGERRGDGVVLRGGSGVLL